MIRRALILMAFLLWAPPVSAVEPDEILDDPGLESRAREISKDLRCLVCQNQSIDDSDADLAKDLRVLVRERLTKGDSNREVIDYVVSRYGDFVLLNPPVKGLTYALWFGPPVILALGVIWAVAFYRRRRIDADGVGTKAAPLSEAERVRLSALLDDDDEAGRA